MSTVLKHPAVIRQTENQQVQYFIDIWRYFSHGTECMMCHVCVAECSFCSVIMQRWLGTATDIIVLLWAAVLPSSVSTFSLVMSMLQFTSIHQAVTFARHLTLICHMVTAMVMIHQCTWLLAMQWNLFFGLYALLQCRFTLVCSKL